MTTTTPCPCTEPLILFSLLEQLDVYVKAIKTEIKAASQKPPQVQQQQQQQQQ